ncbi:unnamed protein product [Toxocara canis]|uniref:MFS domain-containing protein n=1 Tax=Toxocara canis TaxID=6265 RepID=A0A183TWG3_TOXCA|nr:unnamed protein product [Toxocara canis]
MSSEWNGASLKVGARSKTLLHWRPFTALWAANHSSATTNNIKTWGVGFAVVTVSAFAAPLGIMFVPLLSNSLYERAMSLLVALGIGALSGSIMFIMLPQALEVTDYSSSEHLTKSLIVLGSLYGFFAVDRLIQFVMEAKRRYRSRHVGRDEGVTSNGGSSSCSASKLCSNEAAEVDDVISKEIEQIQADIEISSVNSAITRTFSCRRRTPFISTAEGCNTQTKSPSNTLQVPAIATIYSPGSTMPADVATEEECGKRVSVSVAVVEQIEVPRDKLKVASVAYMIILGSSANNLIDGMSNGVAFADSLVRGLSIGIACIAQQFPQEIGTLAILIKSGLGLKRTLLLDLIPAALSYTGFTIGAFLDNLSEGADNYVFSISSGMYLYVFLGTLIPEVRDSTNELIKTNLKESIVATLLQFVGISVAWGIGLLTVTLSAFSAPLGILLVPLFSKQTYDRVMSLLVALGIGALSGSIMFIMLPQVSEFIMHRLTFSWFFPAHRTSNQSSLIHRATARTIHKSTLKILTGHNNEPCDSVYPSALPTICKPCEDDISLDLSTRSAVIGTYDSTVINELGCLKASFKVDMEVSEISNALVRRLSSRRAMPVIQKMRSRATSVSSHTSTTTSGRSSVPRELKVPIIVSKAVDEETVDVSVAVVDQMVVDHDKVEIATVAYMIIFGSAANNFIDGMSNGVAFGDSLVRGLSIGLACVAQQFPQELGLLAILVQSGLGMRRALLLNLIPGALSYVGFTIGAKLDNTLENADNYVFAISAGMYLYVFLGTLIPEARESTNALIKTNLRKSLVATALQVMGITIGMVFMEIRPDSGEITPTVVPIRPTLIGNSTVDNGDRDVGIGEMDCFVNDWKNLLIFSIKVPNCPVG